MIKKFFYIVGYICLAISIITLPLSKKIIIPLQNSLDIGIYLDFNFILIFLFQFFVYISIICFLIYFKPDNKFIIISFIYLIFVEVKFFLSYDLLMLYTYITIYLSILLFYMLTYYKLKKEVVKLIGFCIGFNIISQTSIAIAQLINQSSIGLYFFGENIFDKNTLGIAKFYIGDNLIIRPYGTFTHPNTLAIFLILSIVCIYILNISPIWKKILYITASIGIFTTMSRVGIISLIIIFLLYSIKDKYNKKNIILFTIFILIVIILIEPLYNRFFNILDESMYLRIHYYYTNIMSFIHNNLIYGCIDCRSTDLINKYNYFFMFPWEYQYVHNTILLILNWFGIIGTFILLSFLNKTLLNINALILCTPILFFALFEHNIITSIQILFFCSITLGIYTSTINNITK